MKQPNGNATQTAIKDSLGDKMGQLSEQQVAAIHEFVDLVGGWWTNACVVGKAPKGKRGWCAGALLKSRHG